MNKEIKRRDFIKITSLLPFTYILPGNPSTLFESSETKQQNILIIVFDTLSALHLDLFGYPRNTAPNFNRFAKIASVYHSHYSGGNFTMPGTASLLTGNYPWTHRAFNFRGQVMPEFEKKNIFSLFDQYFRLAFSHNIQVNGLLNQFYSHLDYYKPRQELYLDNNYGLNSLFSNDFDNASVSLLRILNKTKTDEDEASGFSNSLFLSNLYEIDKDRLVKKYSNSFPIGLPASESRNYFLLEDAIDWVKSQLAQVPQPFLGYFHFMPPHNPYNTRKEFSGKFINDGYVLIKKPESPFDLGQRRQSQLNEFARQYDEFILYADNEFGRLLDWLTTNDLLENTWVVLTSDHGELFERGIWGHITPALYQSVIRIPLLIHAPGQQQRKDIYLNTSAVDILPTLAYVTNQPAPYWSAGNILPPYQEGYAETRPVFTVEAKGNIVDQPLQHATLMIVKEQQKLIYYFGYDKFGQQEGLAELFNLNNDPQELHNLIVEARQTPKELLEELLQHLQKAEYVYK